MSSLRVPKISARPLELATPRPTSFARLAAADAGLGLGVVSILCGALGAFDDGGDALVLIVTGAVATAVGIVARRSLERRHRPAPGRVLSGLALAWLLLVLLGAMVYLASGTIERLDDALLESASGFSTVSMTTLDPTTLTVPMQLFRAATQWVGGLLGIIVGVVSLPLALRRGGTEGAASHAAERLAPTVLVGRRRVMAVYTVLTIAIGIAYAGAGLGARESVVHAFTTPLDRRVLEQPRLVRLLRRRASGDRDGGHAARRHQLRRDLVGDPGPDPHDLAEHGTAALRRPLRRRLGADLAR